MRTGLGESGSVLVSMATWVVLASAGAVAAQGDPSSTPAQPGDGRASPLTLEGFVLAPDGSPAEGAVVVSSAGGRAVTDVAGNYRLEIDVPLEATCLQVTAVDGARETKLASTSVVVNGRTSTTRVDPLRLALGTFCSPSWLPTFGEQPGTSGIVQALAVHDDGGGPALYVGGAFTSAGGERMNSIAEWNGSRWAALGSGMNGPVNALASHDDGSGPALYAGGGFTTTFGVTVNHVARWNGSSWAALGIGMDGSVNALAVYDDGGGPALYAGGYFSRADDHPATRLAKWNGSSWQGLQAPLNSVVRALTVFDDGSGPALYAGGGFTTAGGVAANRIAKWDGSSWAALGNGMNGEVLALASHDDGSGPALYAGGYFTIAGGVPANYIARWNGSSWAALGSGMSNEGSPAHVAALSVHDDGSGPALYAGGDFVRADDRPAARLAKWNGSSWSGLQAPLNQVVSALADFDGGSGSALYAGGVFTIAGGVGANRVAKWDGSSWSSLGSGMDDDVLALTVYDDGPCRRSSPGASSRAPTTRATPSWRSGASRSTSTRPPSPVPRP